MRKANQPKLYRLVRLDRTGPGGGTLQVVDMVEQALLAWIASHEREEFRIFDGIEIQPLTTVTLTPVDTSAQQPVEKPKRGRKPGSKNRKKDAGHVVAVVTNEQAPKNGKAEVTP